MTAEAVKEKRPKLFDLIHDVAEAGTCSACGACVVACPYGILQYENDRPEAMDPKLRKKFRGQLGGMIIDGRPQDFCMISENVGCDLCAMSCPKLELPKERLEMFMFGRPATSEERDNLGVYKTIEFTRTRDPRVKERAQDGGFVTTLLLWALKEGIIDGAVVTRVSPTEPCKPVPFVATTPEEILQSAGSWYTYSPNTLGLMEAMEMGLEKVAFVGTPCQVTPLRRLLAADRRDFALVDPQEKNFLFQYEHISGIQDIVAFIVGLLCSETFVYDKLMKKHIEGELNIPLADITKFNIKGKVLVHRTSGEVIDFPLKDVFPYARPECSFCGDFSSEEADISAGGVGTDGWTLTMPRTDRGLELYEGLKAAGLVDVKPAEEFPRSLTIAQRLAKKQRERRRKAYEARRAGEKPTLNGGSAGLWE